MKSKEQLKNKITLSFFWERAGYRTCGTSRLYVKEVKKSIYHKCG